MRRSATGQLALVFADNPCPEASGNGSGGAAASDASGAKAWLLQRANGKEASGADARATEPLDTARLLERAASLGNLSRALLNVARNKGAPGVDGRSVEEVVGSARRLVPRLRQSLLSGSYQPGAIRRVWIAKPGGGRRGLGIPNVVDRVVQQALLQVMEPSPRSTRAATVFVRVGVRPRPSPRPKSTCAKATTMWWTLTCRSSSTGSITSGC